MTTAQLSTPPLVLRDHTITVPLDHDEPDGRRIELYGREVVAPHREHDDLPWLLYLEGGPGMPAPRPVHVDGWLARALEEYRVLLLDPRGTGRSTPVQVAALRMGNQGERAPQEQARYLGHFRADSIVKDAEAVRRSLIGDEPWSVLGPSFGGCCVLTYLSFAPEGLREAFVSGGLPGLDATADDVYRRLYPRVIAKNTAYYARYPADHDLVRRVARLLAEREVRLRAGQRLTVEAFQSLGRFLGLSGGADRLHYLLETAFAGGTELSEGFLFQVDAQLSFLSGAPLYVLVHEAAYAQGAGPTAWSAQRIRAEFAEFDALAALDGDDPVLFTGEMMYPWMVGEDPLLHPLREAADLLAQRSDWPALYDADRLRDNRVPAAAVIYHDDMYLDTELSLRTAASVRGLNTWVTGEYDHNGMAMAGGPVLDRLIGLARGTA